MAENTQIETDVPTSDTIDEEEVETLSSRIRDMNVTMALDCQLTCGIMSREILTP